MSPRRSLASGPPLFSFPLFHHWDLTAQPCARSFMRESTQKSLRVRSLNRVHGMKKDWKVNASRAVTRFCYFFTAVVLLSGLTAVGVWGYRGKLRTVLTHHEALQNEPPIPVKLAGVKDPAAYREGYEFARKWAAADNKTREKLAPKMNAEAKSGDERSWQAGFAKGLNGAGVRR